MEQRERLARTIAGLFNAARPQGMGFIRFRPGDMTPAEAAAYADRALVGETLHFDYLEGRVMKVSMSAGGVHDLHLWERDNGNAQAAIEDGLTDPQYAALPAPVAR